MVKSIKKGQARKKIGKRRLERKTLLTYEGLEPRRMLAATVVDVLIAGSGNNWHDSFKTQLQTEGLGNGGYSLAATPAGVDVPFGVFTAEVIAAWEAIEADSKELGIVTITGNTLTVTLTNSNDSYDLLADGIHLQRLDGLGGDDNFHLMSTSPAIDAGDPLSDYLAEPATNGGRINVGRYGNTSEAATSPPTPNPAAFVSAPAAISDSAISMTAVTGSDPSGPVEYFFNETSGNPGGTDSGWQTSASYTDTGLNPSTLYTYTVQMRDSVPNTGTASGGESATTQAAPDTDAPTSDPATFAVSEANAVEYLKDHFAPLYSTFGDNSTTVVNLVSGPAIVAMNNTGAAGKQWIAESGGYQFKLTIEDAVTDVTIGDLVTRVEELPEPYIRACKEVSDDGEQGIALYVTLGGATAHGSMTYINMVSGAGSLIIAHETGHTLDQLANVTDPTIGDQWIAAIVSDNVSVSGYGDGPPWEDLAEFAQLYAVCLGAGSESLDELYSLSPTRFDLWEMLLFPPVPGDIDAPTPNPATFASAPSADSETAISMTATTGTDASGPVHYYFAETSGNSGGDDSGWQRSSIYTDTGLSASTQYTYTVQMRDAWSNTGTASAAANATTNAPDTDAPTPNPATFASAPAAHSDTAISMTATTGTDPSGPVQYYFDETSGNPGGTDSGWQTSTSYTDTGLTASTMYTYSVTMRDSAVATPNEGTASDDASAITDPPRQAGTFVQTSFADLNLDGRVVLAAVNFYDPARIGEGQRTVGVIQGVDFDDFSCTTDDTGSPIALSAGAAGATLSTVFASGFGREFNNPALFGTFLPGSLDNTEAENLANAGINLENSQTATLTFAFGGSYADTDVEIQMLGGGTWNRTDRKGKLVMSVDSVEKGELVDRGTPDLLTFSATTDGSGNLVIEVVNDFHSLGTDDGLRQYTMLTGTTVTVGGSADTDAPTPDPATFASAPAADSDTAISMTATTGTDASGPVHYYFDEVTGNPGGTDSGWQTSASYTDSGLNPSTLYTYTVQMRDSVPNTGTASGGESATTQAAPDTDAPTPDPATFASAPAADSDTAISMTATTGTDASGPVEYYFDEVTGNPGGTDSGWQTSASYTDSGLNPSTLYTYTVQMRDSVPNTGTASAPSNATTQATPDPDFDQDGDVDIDDVNALTLVGDLSVGVAVTQANAKFDLNGDNLISTADLDKWLADAAAFNGFGSPYLKGDADLDGDVDNADIGAAAGGFSGSGATGKFWSTGDFDGDGDVDNADIGVAAGNFTGAAATSATAGMSEVLNPSDTGLPSAGSTEFVGLDQFGNSGDNGNELAMAPPEQAPLITAAAVSATYTGYDMGVHVDIAGLADADNLRAIDEYMSRMGNNDNRTSLALNSNALALEVSGEATGRFDPLTFGDRGHKESRTRKDLRGKHGFQNKFAKLALEATLDSYFASDLDSDFRV